MLKKVDFKTTYSILPILKIKNNRYWNTLSLFSFTFSFRESLYGQIFMVFSYLVISNEQVIGNYNALMSFIGVLSASLIASKIVPQTQKKYHKIASVGYFISMMSLALFPNEKTLLFSYILNGIFLCWIIAISGSLNYQLSSRAKDGHDQGEYIIASEFPIAAGRVASLLIFFIGKIVYRNDFVPFYFGSCFYRCLC